MTTTPVFPTVMRPLTDDDDCHECLVLMFSCYFTARKQEVIRSTELLLDAISCGDFESYSYVSFPRTTDSVRKL